MTEIEKVSLPEKTLGNWTIRHFEIEKDSLASLRLLFQARASAPGSYTSLEHKNRGIIMSDTDAERADHLEFVRAAKGHVLISGLGLGMCIAAVLRKPDVTKVTVLEIDPDLISLVSPHYIDPRLEIININAFDYDPPERVHYGAVWHDIWDAITSANLPEMDTLHAKFDHCSDWQGSWAQDECLRIKEMFRRRRER